MSETLWQIIVTSVLTLFGTLVGIIGSNWQASIAARREREKDERNRVWSLRDFTRDRRLAIRDKRCEQAETFLSAMSNDFHQFRTHAVRLLVQDPTAPPPDELRDFGYWQRKIDTEVYKYGPIVAAISSRKYDLRVPWDKMQQAWKDMATHYAKAYHQVIILGQHIPSKEEFSTNIENAHSAFNTSMRDFYVTVDKIKGSRLK